MSLPNREHIHGTVASAAPPAEMAPLCVDLDGTLVRTDTFLESLLMVLRTAPGRLPGLLWMLTGNRAASKRSAAQIARPDARHLPYRQSLIEYLRAERDRGRRLLLVTGADRSIAESVAGHLGLFDDVLASDGRRNLTRENKASAIREHLKGEPFAYAGDSADDLPVWKAAETAVLAGAAPGVEAKVVRMGKAKVETFPGERTSVSAMLRLLRPSQWSKNLLVFVPLFLSHRVFEAPLWMAALLAFLAFSACASALYIWNDLLDIQADRAHPRKRLRPLASAQVSIPAALGVMGALSLLAVALCASLPPAAWGLLTAYAAGSAVYSLLLKRVVMLDVVALAALYTLRIFLGGAATGIRISVWTTAFSAFTFLSLALVKRLTELRRTQPKPQTQLAGRGYVPEDLPMLASLASAASYLAALVFGLYIQSPEVQLLYASPHLLWLMVPVLVYWLSRALLLANRGELDDDPVWFALRDPASYLAGAACVLVAWIAR